MLDITTQIEHHFLVVVSIVGTLLAVFIIPFIWKTVENYKFKKLEKELKAKYGDDCFSKAS